VTDYASFQWGAVAYPLTTTGGRTILEDADPAIFQALGFLEGVIRLHVGPRWDVEAAAAGRSELVGQIVASTASFDPVPQFQEAQWALPLLAVYRTKGEYGQRTVDRDHDDGHWGIDYILPPFGPGDLERFNPFLRAISQVINDRSDYGYDPNYQSGLNAWAVAGLEYLSVSDYAFTWLTIRGAGTQATTQLFPVLHIEVDVREQRALSGDPIAAPAPPPQLFEDMTGIDVTVESIDSTDPTPVDDIVNLSISTT
jgi:hypothetical protein